MSSFLDAVAKLEGRFVEVGTAGEWADKGQLQSIGPEHIILLLPNSNRILVVKVSALEYVKELPAPNISRGGLGAK